MGIFLSFYFRNRTDLKAMGQSTLALLFLLLVSGESIRIHIFDSYIECLLTMAVDWKACLGIRDGCKSCRSVAWFVKCNGSDGAYQKPDRNTHRLWMGKIDRILVESNSTEWFQIAKTDYSPDYENRYWKEKRVRWSKKRQVENGLQMRKISSSGKVADTLKLEAIRPMRCRWLSVSISHEFSQAANGRT